MTKKFLIQLLLSLVLGAIAVFSYFPFDIWFISFISFSGLLLLINGKTLKQAALIGLCWGFGYFLAGVHWVYVSIRQYGELPTPIALLILALFILYLSLYPMLFSVLLRLLKKTAPAYSIKQLAIAAPIIWQLTEFIRASLLNGFAWLQFGYTQLHSPLKGLFPIIGINGVNLLFSCLCGLISYLVYQFFLYIKLKQIVNKLHIYSAMSALLIFFFAPFFINSISWTKIDTTRQVNISLVQANISQSLRWNSNQLRNTLSTYSSLTRPLLKKSDIIIWSEAAITDLESNQQQYLQELDQLAIENNTAIAVGLVDLKQENNDYHFYNSLIVLGDKQPYEYPTTNRYTKHHLVPFGEYVPLQSLLLPIARLLSIPMSSMSSGEDIQPPLVMKGFNFTTVICYEVILSGSVLKNFTDDTDFLLTVSNDAWFGNSIGPWQHLQMAQTRALEFGRTLIRSTNNGITVIIDPNGNITNKLPQFEPTTLSIELSPSTGLTPYAKWGNIPLFIMLGFLCLLFFIKRSSHDS